MTNNYELCLTDDTNDIDEIGLEEDFPEKDRSRRAERRKNTWNKIRRIEDVAYRTWNGTSQKTNAMFLGHRAAKRNPLKYYVRRRKTSEKNTLARNERTMDAMKEEEAA